MLHHSNCVILVYLADALKENVVRTWERKSNYKGRTCGVNWRTVGRGRRYWESGREEGEMDALE